MRQLERLYLMLDPELARQKATTNVKELHKTEGILRDLDRLSVEAVAANLAGLPKLIGHTYYEGEPVLVEVANKLAQCRGVIPKRGQQTAAAYVQRVGEQFGLKRVVVGRSRIDGEARNQYMLVPKYEGDGLLTEVYKSIDRRYKSSVYHTSKSDSEGNTAFPSSQEPEQSHCDTPPNYLSIDNHQVCHTSKSDPEGNTAFTSSKKPG